ncbi:hypothetical protein QWA_18222 [Alcaligenes faecalis subsp. faecalis NCIB 8687]|nr:hypothetical protein QWA_18222 [Alcaligenes faecalis subsp. faecalis NCIB 8687]
MSGHLRAGLQKGIKVTVLEAGPQVAGQTSFANGGQLSYPDT